MTKNLLPLLTLALAQLTPIHNSRAEPSQSPNIIFMMLDNVGPEWFGCYGSLEDCTPNIDRLAAQGTRFEHVYTPPVCGPSRTVLLTGRYPHSTGFHLHHDAALYSGGGLDPKREILFPRLFQKAGYSTAISGKWQVNNLYDEPDILSAHGFDQHLVWPGSIDPQKLTPEQLKQYWDAVKREDADETTAFIQNIESRYWDPIFLRNGKREKHPGAFGPDLTQDFAIDFIRSHRDRPFMLYYPVMLTHGATFTVPVVDTPDHQQAGRSNQEMFADMLRYADKQVGQIAALLDELQISQNTLFFIASDNGTEKSFTARTRSGPITGGLYTLSEAGSRVALLAHCPGRIPPGRVQPLADFTDLYPTFCELANIPLSPDHQPDGVSFAAFLTGQTDTPPRDWILNEYNHIRVIRNLTHKLHSSGQLYHLETDPLEQIDLAHSNAPIHQQAKQSLQAILDSLPADSPPPFHLRSQSGFRLRYPQ
jgi:arylsulfatase A-like enzyme